MPTSHLLEILPNIIHPSRPRSPQGSIHTLKENEEALVAATREIGLEVSAD